MNSSHGAHVKECDWCGRLQICSHQISIDMDVCSPTCYDKAKKWHAWHFERLSERKPNTEGE